jgi:hypothetical protein
MNDENQRAMKRGEDGIRRRPFQLISSYPDSQPSHRGGKWRVKVGGIKW